MLLRVLIALTFLAVMNLYVAIRAINRWPWAQQHWGIACMIAVCFFALKLVGPLGEHLLFPKLRKMFDAEFLVQILDGTAYAAFGMLTCLFIYTFVADIISVAWMWIAMPADPVSFERRTLLTLGAVTAGTMAIGIGQAVSGPVIRKVDIPLKGLPKNFDGFKIVQISDLHVSAMIRRSYVENVVSMANSLNADIIALTGDFVDGTVEDLKDQLAPLSTLQAGQGVFFVTGNHEYYWDADAWCAEHTRLGARVLTNEHEVIKRDGEEIILAGVSDYSTLHSGAAQVFDPMRALVGAPKDRVKILLAHQPVSYDLAQKAGFDLQLSGHTHAGQYFPFSLFIAFFQRYYKGLNRHKNMWVYVNTGTGFWGPPLRTAVPAEITLITLRPETA